MKYTIRIGLMAALSAFTTLALSSCAQHTYSWNKPGATQAEFQMDKYNCEKDMRQSGYYGYDGTIGGEIVAAINMQEFGERCMEAHGYTKVQINQAVGHQYATGIAS